MAKESILNTKDNTVVGGLKLKALTATGNQALWVRGSRLPAQWSAKDAPKA